ncbi:MAG: hypothetical protein ACXAEU_17725 [Candidatus Hodarchaeales archaeon]|jgi:hypothetical protein
MEYRNEARHIPNLLKKNTSELEKNQEKVIAKNHGKIVNITEFVHRHFVIFNYHGQAAVELLEVFSEKLKVMGDWHPIDIEIDEARFLNFIVGPMAFFYHDLPCHPEILIMLPAKAGIIEKSYQWFTENLNFFISFETCANQQGVTSFKIVKKMITKPDKTVTVNYQP